MNEELTTNNKHVNDSDADVMKVEGTPKDLSKTIKKVREDSTGEFKPKPIVQKQPK